MGGWSVALVAWVFAQAGSAPADVGKTDEGEHWLAPASSRIKPSGVPQERLEAAKLTAARGERESFYLVLPSAEALSITATELVSGDQVIASSNVRVYRSGYVGSKDDEIADALVPFEAGSVSMTPRLPNPGENEALFVEVAIPREAKPGRYRGALNVRAGTHAFEVPLSVRVLPVQLPATASLPTAFSFSARSVALGESVQLDPTKLTQLSRAYTLSALASRVTLVGGSGLAPSYTAAPGGGDLRLDFAAFDREVAPMMDGVTELEGARASAITLRYPTGLNRIGRFKYRLAFKQHLAERGWADRLVDLDEDCGSTALLEQKTAQGSFQDCLAAARQGRHIWWRLPTSGALSLGIGADRVGLRAIGWLAYRAQVAGLAYEATIDGFDALTAKVPSTAALFYPASSKTGFVVVESVRLKLLRQGLEDYELLRLAERNGLKAEAQRWAAELAPDEDRYARSEPAYEKAKVAIAEKVADKQRRDEAPAPKLHITGDNRPR